MNAESNGTWVFAIAYDADNDLCPTSDNLPDGSQMSGACAMHLIADNPTSDPGKFSEVWGGGDRIRGGQDQSSDPGHRFYSQGGGGDYYNL